MKHVFILNPVSGRESAKTLIPIIEEYFKTSNDEFEILKTEYAGHAKVLASQFHKEDDVCIYATGGDGTLWEVVNGLDPEVTFSIIPSGTGNDFFRMIEANIYDMPKLVKDTIEGEQIQVDYGICNDMRFINCLCMGVDADVNARVCEVGKASMMPKKLLYLSSALNALTHLKPLEFRVWMNGKEEVKQGLLAAVMNGRKYGGGFTPTPNANMNDGLFDVCFVQPVKFARLATLFPQYFKGTHLEAKEVEMSQTESIRFQFEQEINVCLDGEMFRMKDIDAKIVKGGMTLKVPRGSYHEH